MIEDVPILSINIKIWKFCSVILQHNWRRYLFVIPVVIMNALQFVYLYEEWDEMNTFILNAFYAIAIFNSLLRTGLVILNRSKFEDFMKELEAIYNHIEKRNDFMEKSILMKATSAARKISIFNLSASFLDLICALIYPFFSQSKVHPYGVAIPGVDVKSSPIYEIIYILQLATPVVLTSMYMPFVSLFASFAMFGTAALKTVQIRLRQICHPAKTEAEIYMELIGCIQYYTRIARYVKEFNSLVTYIVFAEFLIYSAILSALLFCLNIIKSIMQIITIIMYIMTMFYVLFTYYWQANKLLTESADVANAVYDMEWFHGSKRFKKLMLMFLIRSQRPMMIMVGNMYPMTLETFQSLLNASYSYFTLLRGVYK